MRRLKTNSNKQFALFSESLRHLKKLLTLADISIYSQYIVKNCVYNQAFGGYLLLYEFPTVAHRRQFTNQYRFHRNKATKLFTEQQLLEKEASRKRKAYRKQRKTKIKARHYARVKYRIKTRVRRPLLEGAATIELYDLARHYARIAAIKDLI